MINEQTKLEELMYISLVGKFNYKHICDDNTYLCFVALSDDVTKNEKITPVYITSTNVVSDRVALNRLHVFEKKVFAPAYANYFKSMDETEKLSFSKRIKDYMNTIYVNESAKSQKAVVKNYKNNLINLLKENVIDKEEFEAAIEYVTKHFNKFKENVH